MLVCLDQPEIRNRAMNRKKTYLDHEIAHGEALGDIVDIALAIGVEKIAVIADVEGTGTIANGSPDTGWRLEGQSCQRVNEG